MLYFRLLRVKHWVKNSFILLPFAFSKSIWSPLLSHPESPQNWLPWKNVFFTFFSFCFVASGVYILNDWLDREQDKIHPKKKFRPIPSGQVSKQTAFSLIASLWGAGLSLSYFLVRSPENTPHHSPFFCILAYLVLNIAYSYKLKHQVILDVMTIATGFILRVLAGATAIQASTSPWLFICTSMLALFLGFCKRRNEITMLDENRGEHRKVLEHYSLPFLDQMISLVTACTLISYILYTIDPETVRKYHTDKMYLTIPFVLYGILRYFYLVYHREEGGDPTEILYTDPGILTTCALWFLCVLYIIWSF